MIAVRDDESDPITSVHDGDGVTLAANELVSRDTFDVEAFRLR